MNGEYVQKGDLYYKYAFRFGSSVAISDDGATIAVGAPGNEEMDQGYVFVFERPESGWSMESHEKDLAHVIDWGSEGDGFGSSIAMTADGSVILTGAPKANGYTGSTVLSLRPGDSWKGQTEHTVYAAKPLGYGKLKPGDEWGHSVAISADGSVITIGAPGGGISDDYKKNFFVFQRPEEGWMKVEELFPVVIGGIRGGQNIALNSDGSRIAVSSVGSYSKSAGFSAYSGVGIYLTGRLKPYN